MLLVATQPASRPTNRAQATVLPRLLPLMPWLQIPALLLLLVAPHLVQAVLQPVAML